MKILYIDFNAPDLVEDYGLQSSRYGGGRIVAANLMPHLNNNGHYMEIWADERCFDGVEIKYKRFCKGMSYDERNLIKNGAPLANFAKDFDIVLHNFHGFTVNCSGTLTKNVVWLVGYGEFVNPTNTRIILYNDYQHPRITNPDTKIYYARIGVPITEFKEIKKEDFIFSCHRQSREFGAETMMRLAHKYKLRYITAGPRDSNFQNIMDYVDNKYVMYLGEISDKVKREFYKRAYCSTYLHSWNTPFNLSACESLAVGTPVIATNIGFWPSLIQNHKNGFLIKTQEDFQIAISNVALLSQRGCYDSVLPYSTQNMIQDYVKVLTQIIEEK